MKPNNEGTVKVERQVRATARWGVSCWSKKGMAHLFDFEDEESHVLRAVCGHYRVMLNDLQPMSEALWKCSRCEKAESA